MGYDNCFNANRRTLNYWSVNRSQCSFSFFYWNRLLISHLCFDSELFITFLVGLFLRAVGRKRTFLFGRFIACINTYLHAKFKNNLSGEVCKIDKPPNLSMKTLKIWLPEKWKRNISFSNLKYLQRLQTSLEFWRTSVSNYCLWTTSLKIENWKVKVNMLLVLLGGSLSWDCNLLVLKSLKLLGLMVFTVFPWKTYLTTTWPYCLPHPWT